MTFNHVAEFVVKCKIVLVKKYLAFVPPWIFDRWDLRLGIIVGTGEELRFDMLGEGGGHSGNRLLRIDEACSRDIDFMSINGLLFAAFTPGSATFVNDARYGIRCAPLLCSRKVALGMLLLSVKENTYWLFFLRGIMDLPVVMLNTEWMLMRSVTIGGRY
jgi:hypothetical protein